VDAEEKCVTNTYPPIVMRRAAKDQTRFHPQMLWNPVPVRLEGE